MHEDPHFTTIGDSRNGSDETRTMSLQATTVRLAAVGTALLLVVFLVVTASRAAFSATTINAGNSVSTGTVTLTDDDSGTAMFDTLSNLAPLSTATRCIHVDYTGSIDPDPVLLYIDTTPTGTLDQYLDLTVEIGPDNADAFGACTSFSASSTLFSGTLESFASTHDSYANGLSTWDPSGVESRTFRFVITVQDDAGANGQSAGWGFTWATESP